MPGSPRGTVVAPGKRGINNGRQRSEGDVVALVEGKVLTRITDGVAEQGIIPCQRAANGFGVRVEHDFLGIETVSLPRIVRAMDPVAIQLVGLHVRQISVPDLIRLLRQHDPLRLRTIGIEETKLNLRGVLRKNSEVNPGSIPGWTQWIRSSWPDAYGGASYLLPRR